MNFKSIKPTQLFILVVILSVLSMNAQTDDNLITYKAPSDAFEDITIQSHNGLPRFGLGQFMSREKLNALSINTKAYIELLNFKFGEAVYKDIDLKNITNTSRIHPNDVDKKDENSVLAQRQLLKLARNVSKEETLKKYFCEDGDKPPCNFINRNKERISVSYWGGNASRGNEFRQTRSYQSYIKDNYSPLKEYSKTIFKGGSEIGYMVYRGTVSVNRFDISKVYDFDKKGYWLSYKSFIGAPSIRAKMSAFTKDEKTFANNDLLLFPVAPDKAKKLALKVSTKVYLVAKVKVSYDPNNVTAHTADVTFSYELLEKTFKVYKDDALTELIGEIKLENIVAM
jgi:hypothetical protein